jgi:hypothetical protein
VTHLIPSDVTEHIICGSKQYDRRHGRVNNLCYDTTLVSMDDGVACAVTLTDDYDLRDVSGVGVILSIVLLDTVGVDTVHVPCDVYKRVERFARP